MTISTIQQDTAANVSPAASLRDKVRGTIKATGQKLGAVAEAAVAAAKPRVTSADAEVETTPYGAMYVGTPEHADFKVAQARHDSLVVFRAALADANKTEKLALCDAYIATLKPIDRDLIEQVQWLRTLTESGNIAAFSGRIRGLDATIDASGSGLSSMAQTCPRPAHPLTVARDPGQPYGTGARGRN